VQNIVPVPAMPTDRLERLLRRDRAIVVAALVGLTLVSWLYVVQMGREPLSPVLAQRFGVALALSCCGVDPWATFLMWTVMMVGMMVPSVAPMVLSFAMLERRRYEKGQPFVPTAFFLGGYLLAWAAFSAVATAAQWSLFRLALLDPHRQTVGPWLGAALLVGAGLFQLSPAKNACLAQCRSPLGFLMTEWREGTLGAVRMGLRHGWFCIGCCALLMGLLFVAGVMNLLWVAGIAAYVLAEKVLPWGRGASRAGAGACFLGAIAILGHAWRLATP
jgi:predicted metal-binding membrane protein